MFTKRVEMKKKNIYNLNITWSQSENISIWKSAEIFKVQSNFKSNSFDQKDSFDHNLDFSYDTNLVINGVAFKSDTGIKGNQFSTERVFGDLFITNNKINFQSNDKIIKENIKIEQNEKILFF